MAITVLIPTPLRKLTNNQESVTVESPTVDAMVDDLNTMFPGFGDRMRDESGALRRYVNFYVNDEDIRFLQNKDTSLKDGDNVSIVPAIAGG